MDNISTAWTSGSGPAVVLDHPYSESITWSPVMHSFDPTPYMFGEALSVVIGIAIGAMIVGLCWNASNLRVDKALNQANWDNVGELDRVWEESALSGKDNA